MKKQLFALTLAGLILLPACVKEVESPSVTAARQAKAEQLASITALNNANAQAQLTLANAEAALKAAEAKAKEAEALKISAETELIKVQAELAAVEVEIAKVKLEEEKVALEIKKAELEAKLVQLETLKAQAEVTKKKAAAELERLAIDIQTQLLNSQKALIEARNAYNQAASQYDRQIAQDYFDACAALYNAQTALAGLQIELAQAQNDLVDFNEAKAKSIIWNNKEIAKLKLAIERLEAMRGLSIEELSQKEVEAYAAYLEAFKKLNEANSLFVAAEEEYDDAKEEIDAYYSGLKNTIARRQGWVDSFGLITTYIDGEQIGLLTTQEDNDESYTCPDLDGYTYWDLCTVTPAKLNKEGLELLIKAQKEDVEESYERDLTSEEDYLEEIKSRLYRSEVELARAKANVAEYQAEYDAAVEKSDSAYKAYIEAENAYYEFVASNTNGDYSEWREADARYAQSIQSYNDAYNAYISYPVESAQSYVEFCEDQVALNENAVKQAKDAISEEDATAVETAQAKVDAQKAVVAAKQTAYDEAYAAMRAARLANIATPSTENQAAEDEAVAALDEAKEVLDTEKSKLAELEDALSEAEEKVEDQLRNLKDAEDALENAKEDLEDAKKGLAESIANKQKMDAAEEAMDAAKAAVDAAYEKYSQNWEHDSEFNKLQSAAAEAWNAFYEAKELRRKAAQALADAKWRNRYDDRVNNVNHYGEQVRWTENNIENIKNTYAQTLKDLAQYEEDINEYIAGEAEYHAAVEQYNGELRESLIAAFEAYAHANAAIIEAWTEYDAASTALTKANDLESVIEARKSDIRDLEAKNENLREIKNQESLISHLKAQISGKEAEIVLLQSQVDAAKKALDAATTTK